MIPKMATRKGGALIDEHNENEINQFKMRFWDLLIDCWRLIYFFSPSSALYGFYLESLSAPWNRLADQNRKVPGSKFISKILTHRSDTCSAVVDLVFVDRGFDPGRGQSVKIPFTSRFADCGHWFIEPWTIKVSTIYTHTHIQIDPCYPTKNQKGEHRQIRETPVVPRFGQLTQPITCDREPNVGHSDFAQWPIKPYYN